jgi:proteasome lid subunit RPN8/RPN11
VVGRLFGLQSAEAKRIRTVVTPASLEDELLTAAAAHEAEICGALYGAADVQQLRLESWLPLPNRASSGQHFEVLVTDLLSARKDDSAVARQRLVGIFHTHPTAEAALSPLDYWYLSVSPFVWAIGTGRVTAEAARLRYFVQAGGVVRELVSAH